MKNTQKIMETLEAVADGMSRGLIYVKEDYTVGACSNLAKEITGMTLAEAQSHEAGKIEEGDIVIIADNDLGSDDGLLAKDLEYINIRDVNIKAGDAVLAVGVYKNKDIKPVYKFASSYMPGQVFKMVERYLGFKIAAEIDFGRNRISIRVDEDTYTMKYLEAIGHTVVLDKNSGRVKFFQAKGYSFRHEEVGNLLRGQSFLEKKSRESGKQEFPVIGEKLKDLFSGEEFFEAVKKAMGQENGSGLKNVYEIHKRPLYCHLVRVKVRGDSDGVYVFIQDSDIVESQPASKDVMVAELEKLRRKRQEQGADFKAVQFSGLIGNGEEMMTVKHMAYKASQNRFNVIITGESGTGKSMLARMIHEAQMPDAPFVEVCCNAISPTLFESELFGYVPGAFTGALAKGKAGYFEEADGGTIFLDEIGDIPPEIQIKLLHAIQNKRIYRVGDTKPIGLNVRIISATNRELQKEIEKGTFREDLYYRIGVFPIHIPPLRERKKDLYFLANEILEKCCKRYGLGAKQLSWEAIADIMDYPWMGNVRELENIIERAASICDGRLIYSEHLMLSGAHAKDAVTLKEKMAVEERRIIKDALCKNNYDRAKTIEELGISRASFYQKLKELNIED